MANQTKHKLPLDFRLWAVAIVYIIGLVLVGYYGWQVGARFLWMFAALVLGFIAGLPAARWEIAAIYANWDEIITGPVISYRLPYFKHEAAKKRTQYFLAATFLVPLIFLFFAWLFYWDKILRPVEFGWTLVLLIKWNGWYWLPYIFGLEFSSTHFPRLVAAASYRKNLRVKNPHEE